MKLRKVVTNTTSSVQNRDLLVNDKILVVDISDSENEMSPGRQSLKIKPKKLQFAPIT